MKESRFKPMWQFLFVNKKASTFEQGYSLYFFSVVIKVHPLTQRKHFFYILQALLESPLHILFRYPVSTYLYTMFNSLYSNFCCFNTDIMDMNIISSFKRCANIAMYRSPTKCCFLPKGTPFLKILSDLTYGFFPSLSDCDRISPISNLSHHIIQVNSRQLLKAMDHMRQCRLTDTICTGNKNLLPVQKTFSLINFLCFFCNRKSPSII